ncbi:hypothetical protein QAD02_022465 [Eretmocerus hayati]|uniref:Uncharacterized protein n=1 Tax=Eretmocerus hayati TaxID=131215 RepID=A0ACC2PUR3_9HYME|nr:hypothetical protein QAD02_022465 [Eretmocerus hayati]
MKKQPQKDVSNQENTKANPEQEAVSEDLKNLRKLINDLENNHVVQTKELEAQKMTQCISEKPDIELVKNDNKQYVFEINYKDESTNETYFVQILKSKAKLELGKLKMPSGLDFERILSETPLTDNQGITRFIRNCQRYISFYHKRKKKFHQCQSYLHDAVNCHIDTNHNYSTFYLQLLKVFDASVDGFYNVTIYLFFDLASSEATEIKVETSADKDHKNAALQHLEFCLEIFSDGEIEDALKVFEEDEKTGPISWKLEFADGDLEYSSVSIRIFISIKIIN